LHEEKAQGEIEISEQQEPDAVEENEVQSAAKEDANVVACLLQHVDQL